jgi:hypothetical protein
MVIPLKYSDSMNDETTYREREISPNHAGVVNESVAPGDEQDPDDDGNRNHERGRSRKPECSVFAGQRAGDEMHGIVQAVVQAAGEKPEAVVVEHREEHVHDPGEDQERSGRYE